VNLDVLGAMVAQGESEQLELKRSTGQRSDAAKTICAMLNGGGGFVLFGVTDAGEIVGQDVSARTLEDVVLEIRRIEPPVSPDISTTMLDNGRAVIAVQIPVQVMGVRGPFTYSAWPRPICFGRMSHGRGIR
jgi:ATP-dependent DNA helicase RecG